jgi:hypothetical protein
MKFLVTILFFMISAQSGFCQNDTGVYKVPYKIENGDTVYQANLKAVNIVIRRTYQNKWDERKYWRLVYNLKKVYPYAKMAGAKFKEMNEHFLTLHSEKEKKIYTKQVEKEIREKFEKDLTNLTVTQGKLLIKLIDRETGKTSYELLKELKGNLSAIFWQTLARIFGHNLKTEYDAAGADKLTEEILIAIDEGYL